MRYLYYLLLLAPAALVLHLTHGGHVLVFVASAVGLVPISALLGKATEDLATHLGPRVGGLLNVALGNAAELIIGITALRQGHFELVKASISGSILGNLLLVLGLSLVAGGLKHGSQKFDARLAGMSATMMTLAVVALVVPALFAGGPHHAGASSVDFLSVGLGAVLIVLYALYVLYTIFLHRGEVTKPKEDATVPEWSVPLALGLLTASIVGAGVMSDLLVGVIEPIGSAWGLTELFLGVMIVPLVGNVAEQWTAIAAAARDDVDVSLSISTGSSVQVALFVAPLLVFVGEWVGHPLPLLFNRYELVALGGAVAVATLIAFDGESNWLEGAQLVAVYVIVGLGFFFLS